MQPDTPNETLKRKTVHPSSPSSRGVAFFTSRWERLRATLIADWQGERVIIGGILVGVIVGLVLTAYYVNHIAVTPHPDTPSFTKPAEHILNTGQITNADRTPGYPLFLAFIFFLFGRENLLAVTIVQGILFVVTAIELYAVTILILRRTWVAVLVGLCFGLNFFIFNYVKVVIAEGFALWLAVSLALVTVMAIRAPTPRRLWLVAAWLLVLFMTRPEWIYLPLPLFAYLIFIAARRGMLRAAALHGGLAVVTLYAVLGLYIFANGVQTGFHGLTYVQNINLLGKVMQYRMQDEAPPSFADARSKIDTFVAQRQQNFDDPFGLAIAYPEFQDNYWHLAGEYANTIVFHHPIEFAVKSLPVIFYTSNYDYAWDLPVFHNPFGRLFFIWRDTASLLLYRFQIVFPWIAFGWLALLLWWRTSRRWPVEAMAGIALLGLYELVLTAVGTYIDYPRLHVPLNALITVVIWGSIGIGADWLWHRWRERQASKIASMPVTISGDK